MRRLSTLLLAAAINATGSGDLYHSTIAREQRAVPPFNASRWQTLASIDRFEKLAKVTGAKIIIQHASAYVAKLPAFPQAAK